MNKLTPADLDRIEAEAVQARAIVENALEGDPIPAEQDLPSLILTLVALARQAPRWIPVEERLPEPGVRTLVSQEGAAHILVFVGGGWEDDECWYGPATVTHWMLLPEPPE